MIALDTNVLVRYLTQDDEPQFRSILKMLSTKGERFYLNDLVLAEADWVLRRLYDWTPQEVGESFGRLTTIHNLVFEDEIRVRSGLRALKEGADFADELILRGSRDRGCRLLATFDKDVLRRHKSFAVHPSRI
jgi:predicted nucleic-acid-binding protein